MTRRADHRTARRGAAPAGTRAASSVVTSFLVTSFVALSFVALSVLAACGAAVAFDADAAEDTIASGFAERYGVVAQSVQCPATVVVRRDVTFDCAVLTDNGTPVDVTATFTDNAGAFGWEPAESPVDTAALESDASAALSASGQRVTVTCPDVVFASKGRSFTCEATDDTGGRATVDATVGADGVPTWALRNE